MLRVMSVAPASSKLALPLCAPVLALLIILFTTAHFAMTGAFSISANYFTVLRTVTAAAQLKGVCRVKTAIHGSPVHSRLSIRMDDESYREGVKFDLTARDEYLSTRFKGLSRSGYDVTPMTAEEIATSIASSSNSSSNSSSSSNFGLYLGCDQKGLYVCKISGLPLGSSGHRIGDLCTSENLYFRELCDAGHVYVLDDKLVYCVRSRVRVGSIITSKGAGVRYQLDANAVRFLSINEKWPLESQPENYWGTEGQYIAWNTHSRTGKPLSY